MPPARTLMIVNPQARHGETGRLLPGLADLVDDAFYFETAVTERPGHAAEIAESASAYDLVVAVGGDGTVHEVLSGLMRQSPTTRPVLGLLPTGSGNDYRRTLGMSSDLRRAVRQLAEGRQRRMDVGVCNGVWFANSFSVGLDARVTARSEETKERTGRSGLPLYLTSLFHVLFKRFYTHRVRLSLDGGPVEEREMLLVAMTNGPTYGGGFRITPGAVGDDGLLDVCLIDRVSLFQALWKLPFVILGLHGWMRQVHLSRRERIEVWAEAPLEAQIDGELMRGDHFDVRIERGALKAVVGE